MDLDGTTTTYSDNSLNQYTAVGATNYSYDNNGNITDDGTYEYDYDCENRMIEVDDANSNDVASYKYDYMGRRVEKTVYGTPKPYNDYSYDDLNRLTEADYLVELLTEDEVFTMDDLGNRTNVNLRSGSNQVYDVNDLTNRYNSIDYNNLSYDDAGNLTTDAAGYQYTYDYENRLIGIKDSINDPVATFTYDALGRRIEKYDAVADETTRYYNNHRWQVLAEYDDAADLQRYFVYGHYIDEVLMMVVEGDPDTDYYYVHDHIYSPAALLEDDGTVVERYEYNAYGKLTRLDPDFTTWSGTEAGNPYYFTGRRLDVLDGGDLELMYYRNRSYAPATGRFLQQDPIGYADGMNLYIYVENDPTNLLDPFGLRWWNPNISDKKSCLEYCNQNRDDSLETAKWLYESAKAGLDALRDGCYDACDSHFPSGCPSPKDPLDANEQCKFLCDAAHAAARAALLAEYNATLGAVWGQYGACVASCHILW